MNKPQHIFTRVTTIGAIILGGLVSFAHHAMAEDFRYNSPINGVPNTPQDLFTNIITGLLAISGSFALMMLVIGGFRYVTSAGEKDLIENAKSQIKAAIIGIIIILVSYSILTAVQTIILGG